MKYRRASLKRVKTQNQPHIPKIVKKKKIYSILYVCYIMRIGSCTLIIIIYTSIGYNTCASVYVKKYYILSIYIIIIYALKICINEKTCFEDR